MIDEGVTIIYSLVDKKIEILENINEVWEFICNIYIEPKWSFKSFYQKYTIAL